MNLHLILECYVNYPGCDCKGRYDRNEVSKGCNGYKQVDDDICRKASHLNLRQEGY